jgi:hypothetical protein
MKNGISVFAACIAGILLAYLGAYFTGYTAAFVMPKSFVDIMWLWDILVVQFLGFGFLATILAFAHAKLFSGSLVKSLLVPFVISQIVLTYPFTYILYWPHILVVFGSLSLGYWIAKSTMLSRSTAS